MAPIYCDCNAASDQNQLTMEVMKKVADRHGLVCLLHEKPFAGVNGSGKHNNWSLGTDTGKNLFEPGKTPSQNAQFLLFLAAFIEARGRISGAAAHAPSPSRATTTVSARRRRPRPSSPSSSATELDGYHRLHRRTSSDYTEKTGRQLRIGVDVLPHHPAGYDRPQPHFAAGLHRQ